MYLFHIFALSMLSRFDTPQKLASFFGSFYVWEPACQKILNCAYILHIFALDKICLEQVGAQFDVSVAYFCPKQAF